MCLCLSEYVNVVDEADHRRCRRRQLNEGNARQGSERTAAPIHAQRLRLGGLTKADAKKSLPLPHFRSLFSLFFFFFHSPSFLLLLRPRRRLLETLTQYNAGRRTRKSRRRRGGLNCRAQQVGRSRQSAGFSHDLADADCLGLTQTFLFFRPRKSWKIKEKITLFSASSFAKIMSDGKKSLKKTIFRTFSTNSTLKEKNKRIFYFSTDPSAS
jgi:hypothetical protein